MMNKKKKYELFLVVKLNINAITFDFTYWTGLFFNCGEKINNINFKKVFELLRLNVFFHKNSCHYMKGNTTLHRSKKVIPLLYKKCYLGCRYILASKIMEMVFFYWRISLQ